MSTFKAKDARFVKSKEAKGFQPRKVELRLQSDQNVLNLKADLRGQVA